MLRVQRYLPDTDPFYSLCYISLSGDSHFEDEFSGLVGVVGGRGPHVAGGDRRRHVPLEQRLVDLLQQQVVGVASRPSRVVDGLSLSSRDVQRLPLPSRRRVVQRLSASERVLRQTPEDGRVSAAAVSGGSGMRPVRPMGTTNGSSVAVQGCPISGARGED